MEEHDRFQYEFDALVGTFAELLTGDQSPELMDKIKNWCIYSHIYKTMPHLVAHWSKEHPESKAEVRQLFEEIKLLNEQHRQQTADKPV